MKIRPVILCGGAGTRLWEDKKHHQPKQFIDFGGWALMEKTLERIKNSVFDFPIISTNIKYLSKVKKKKVKAIYVIPSQQTPQNHSFEYPFLLSIIVYLKRYPFLYPLL